MKSTLSGLFAAGLFVLGILSPDSSLAQQKAALSIGSGNTGGVYYPLAGGLAQVLMRHMPGWQVTAEVTGGSIDNLKLVGTGKADLGFSMADAAWDAYTGQDKFAGRKLLLRVLLVLYPNRMHLVSTEASGVATIKDLEGKRVSLGSPGGATEVMGMRVLEAYGMADRIRRERLSVNEAVNAIRDRKIDAFFWVGGLPTAAVTDLAATPGIKIKMVDHAETVAGMNKKYGNLYVEDVIPKTTYSGMQADNKQATVMNILVAHENMSEQTAYNIVKTIFDKREDMIAVHKESENFKYENQKASASPIPFHPGALKYFKEKGVKLQ